MLQHRTLASYSQASAGKRLRCDESWRARDQSCGGGQNPSDAVRDKLLEVHGLAVESERLAASQAGREECAIHRPDVDQQGRREHPQNTLSTPVAVAQTGSRSPVLPLASSI